MEEKRRIRNLLDKFSIEEGLSATQQATEYHRSNDRLKLGFSWCAGAMGHFTTKQVG
jgi:hypothetical protein